MFVAVQLVGFGATFAITQTIGIFFSFLDFDRLELTFCFCATYIAAIGFPMIILLLIPLRTLVVPRLPFTAEELAILDGPTASPFVSRPFSVVTFYRLTTHLQSQTMESVGGTCRT
jgi:hypothetical protein